MLARPEYQAPEPSPLIEWLGRAFGWTGRQLRRLLDRLLPDIDTTAAGWALFGEIVLFIGAIVGALLLAWLVILGLRAWRGRVRASKKPAPGEAAPATARDWEVAARDAAAAGDWRAAAAASYQAVVYRLAEAGALSLDSAKTPGDYRREVRRGRHELAPALEAFVRAFEQVAYGRSAADHAAYVRLRDAAAPLGARV